MDSLTSRWLRQNISHYPAHDRLYPHLDAALSRFSALRPKSDIYTYDDGRTQLLLCLHGLLPVTFRNASYNIPIAIWIVREYPIQPPIVYVVPTNDMLVKPGKYVDVSGRINIEYIQQWQRKSEGCDLSSLLEAMQDHFSREPPVYAKPKESTPQSPPPPSDRPTLPPKPVPSTTHIVPPKEPPLRVGARSEQEPLNPTSYIGAPVGTAIWSPAPPAPPPWSRPVQPPPPPPPPTHPITTDFIIATEPPAPTPNLLDEESPDLSPEPTSSSPPPRPTNPELLRLHIHVHQKLTSELESLRHALSLDAERLGAQQADLQAGEPAIRDEMARLAAVRDVCRHVAERMRFTVNQAERNITELRRKGDPEVDELVCATTIVHNQLINLVAEDNAIEDTIYHLHRALNTGRIDLERFLRTSRVLAEEQFMKRALIEKIRAGLPIGASIGSWS